MAKKHAVTLLLVGWAIALIFPPQKVVNYFKKG